jgi:hypothetical protein
MHITPEAALKICVLSPDFLAICGSRLYGTARYDEKGVCLSDEDLRGFVLPPFEYLVGVKNFDQFELEGDHKIWNLKRYFDLLLLGDPTSLELLFVPAPMVRRITPLGQRVLDARKNFLSKKIFFRLNGYSNSEYRKAIGMKLNEKERTPTEDEIIMDIRNTFRLPKPEMDEVLSVLFSHHPRTLVPSKQGIREKRKAEFEKYGYGTSSACHAIRLAKQCIEFLETGHITFPRPEVDELKAIRYGKVSQAEFEKIYFDVLEKSKKAYEASSLPDKPDYKAVERLYLDIVDTYLSDRYLK